MLEIFSNAIRRETVRQGGWRIMIGRVKCY